MPIQTIIIGDLLTKLGDAQEWKECQVLPRDEALSSAVKSENVLVVGAPNRGEEVLRHCQQRHELQNVLINMLERKVAGFSLQ